jgi:hypothetical protein
MDGTRKDGMEMTERGSYRTYRDGVSTLMEAGEPFDEVEVAIEHTDLEPDEKAALWLFAYTSQDRLEPSGDAVSRLAGAADEG